MMARLVSPKVVAVAGALLLFSGATYHLRAAEDVAVVAPRLSGASEVCATAADCSDNGACVQGECTCNVGFAGARCDRCAAAFLGYPDCALDRTCYAVTWETCGEDFKVLRNDGMLPLRPKRQVNLVPAQNAKDVLGVRVVRGLWGQDTVSLRACWYLSCGKQRERKRMCRWREPPLDREIYLRNTGCTVDVAVKPTRAGGQGNGFENECATEADKAKLVCSLPSQRLNVFMRDASWFLSKDAAGNFFLEAANWRNHFLAGGHRPSIRAGRPDPVADGRLRLARMQGGFQPSCNASEVAVRTSLSQQRQQQAGA